MVENSKIFATTHQLLIEKGVPLPHRRLGEVGVGRCQHSLQHRVPFQPILLQCLFCQIFFAILLWSTYSRPPVFDPLLSDLPAGKLLGLPQVVGELKVVILKALKVVQLAHAETKPWETAISHYSVHTFGSSCEMDNPKLLEHQILFDQYW